MPFYLSDTFLMNTRTPKGSSPLSRQKSIGSSNTERMDQIFFIEVILSPG